MLLKLDSQRRLERQWETGVSALFGPSIRLGVNGERLYGESRTVKERGGKQRGQVEGGDWTSGVRDFERRERGRDEVRAALPLRFRVGCERGMSMGGVVLRLAAVAYGCHPGEDLWRARGTWGDPGCHGRAPARQWWRGRVGRQVFRAGSAIGATIDALAVLMLAKVQFPDVGRFALGVLTAVKLACFALSAPFLRKSRLTLHTPSSASHQESLPLPSKHISRNQGWSKQLQDFASAATIFNLGNPVIRIGFPQFHAVLRAMCAAAEVGRGYAQVRARVERLGPSQGALGEELWRQAHRWGAKRLCRLLHDFQETPTLGWVMPLVEALSIETRTVVGIASSHFAILGYGSPPPPTQFRQLSVSISLPSTVSSARHVSVPSEAASWHGEPPRLSHKPPGQREAGNDGEPPPQPDGGSGEVTAQRVARNREMPAQREFRNREILALHEAINAEVPAQREVRNREVPAQPETRNGELPAQHASNGRGPPARHEARDREEQQEEEFRDRWRHVNGHELGPSTSRDSSASGGAARARESPRQALQTNANRTDLSERRERGDSQGDVEVIQRQDLQRSLDVGEGPAREYEWEKVEGGVGVGGGGVVGWGVRLGLFLRAVWLAVVFVPLLLLAPLLWVVGNQVFPAWRDSVRGLIWRLLRGCLEWGGAAFIKWGQWSATREDLFPPDLCAVLGRMHDRAPTHTYRQSRVAIQDYFGRSVEDIFESFEPAPAASGSIAQVHRATLRLTEDDPPLKVAVKVRHPSVALRIHQDFRIMSALADIAQNLSALRWLNLRQSVDQFSHTMTAQADLRVEARNLLKFSRNFDKLDQTVVFPRIIPELVSEGVLVETFEEGSALHEFLRNRSSSLNTQIAAIGVDTYLKMMLTDNFVHTDLHPGNILARMALPEVRGPRAASGQEGREKVQLVLLDFGLAEELSPSVRFNFISFIIHIGTGDGEQAARHLLRFSEPDPQRCTAPEALISDMRTLFAEECNLLQGPIDLNKVLIQVLRLCHKHGVTINSSYASLVVAVCVLVGFARSLDPMLSIMDAAVPCLFLYNLTGQIVGRIYD